VVVDGSVDVHSTQMLKFDDVSHLLFSAFLSTVLMQKKQSKIMKRKTRQGKALEKRAARSFMDVLQEVSRSCAVSFFLSCLFYK
jgi:hypothetical protein